LSRGIIAKFSRLHLCHNTLPKYAYYKLGLNKISSCVFFQLPWGNMWLCPSSFSLSCFYLGKEALQETCSSFKIDMTYSNLLFVNYVTVIKALVFKFNLNLNLNLVLSRINNFNLLLSFIIYSIICCLLFLCYHLFDVWFDFALVLVLLFCLETYMTEWICVCK